MAIEKALSPENLARLKGLSLKARLIVEGYVSGMHNSPYRGFSAEFAEHREYVPGDDLRYVDWKVFGRTDRHYLRLFDEETNFACHIVVDTSESMSYRSDAAAVTKLEYASWLAAALGWLIVRQRDAAGLVTFDESIRAFLRPASHPAHLKQFIHVLEQAEPSGETSVGQILHELAERIQRRGLVIILSDLFDGSDSVLDGLQHFRFRRHDVSVVQIVDPAEQDFPFDDPTLFRGLEDHPDQFLEPGLLAEAYRAEFEGFLTQIRSGCRSMRFDHSLIRTDQPLDVALTRFLTQRRRAAVSG